jgi:hypothetical protein
MAWRGRRQDITGFYWVGVVSRQPTQLPACSSHRARFVALKNAARLGLCYLAVIVGLKIEPGKMSMPCVILVCDFQQIQGAQQICDGRNNRKEGGV